ncbi:MAG: phosphate acyltransferase PlsX [Candidatus Izemoplasmatales bacterium]|jgi:glycerol-3-phosphate acyltransferase PlsX|nr:phosphate acyltransferase PlsX [Candidatus Izemoplasmatales bacterium]NLF48674.1 phosphate acyltransferase PlsX [Acholeplasmataceae bacterium]MDD4354649.1 phosphate acyltransferase PlsX [Candidatus Izemoplasmatales bacterium]MDD4987933.1 phosphate acyltransferase PlsX [Candidatus Izemoplasmatales bacterium]MDD5601556.1 phosphate acyltransferase PlsX [Candidatus Izemoplasmatales bacterium]
MIRIGIDAMGGDYAPKEQVLGAMMAIRNIPDIELTLYGDPDQINKWCTDKTRLLIKPTAYVISMGEHEPIKAIKEHPDSSMASMLASLRKDENDAVVSSGATQALIAGAHILVRRMQGFKRTAIAPVIPSISGKETILLDAGANLEIRPEHMLQQAYFASVYAREVLNREHPVVGLINIGTEEGKGRQFDQEVFQLFQETDLFDFYGNVEPKSIFDPPCDILISDGFTANIVMKTMEGTAKGIGFMLKRELTRSFWGKIGALLAKRNLNQFKRSIAPDEIGGALIYGLYRPVIKAQGASKAYGFYNAIRQAATIVRNQVFQKVENYIQKSKADDASE